MISRTIKRFRDLLDRLPLEVRRAAVSSYELFRENSEHPSLHFKPLRNFDDVYSVRVSRGYRALGQFEGATITWFWIGSHADYDRIIGGGGS